MARRKVPPHGIVERVNLEDEGMTPRGSAVIGSYLGFTANNLGFGELCSPALGFCQCGGRHLIGASPLSAVGCLG